MRKAIATAFLSFSVLLSPARAADVPSTVALQAALQTAGGAPLNGTYSLTIKLYPSQSSSTVLWTETMPAVQVSGGVLDVVLGQGTPIPATLFRDNGDVWVGVSVAGEPELPRSALRTVAFAFRARSAVSADQAGDLACSGCVAIGELAFDPATQAELDAHAADASAHHTRYTNAEAVAAMGAKAAGNPLHHDRYTNAEAVAAMGAKGAGNPLHHDRYTDAEAVAAVGPALNTVNGKTGGTITGNVTVTGTLSAGGSTVCTAAGNCPDKDALGALSCSSGQSPQWNGSAWVCVSGAGLPTPPSCVGPGKALQWDGSAFACVVVASGGTTQGLGYSLVDSWGATWDGHERPTATWANAKATCEAAGGRLPTATELSRVSYTGTAEVGTAYTSAWLWGIIEEYAGAHIVGRLDNGDISYSADSTVRAYRCIFPPAAPTSFTGKNCHGPAGNPCWLAKREGDRYNVDLWDRPPTSYNVAVRECAFYRAHLAWERDLSEEIMRGLPNGSNDWLWTSDGQGYNGTNFLTGVVRWSGVNTGFDDSYSAYATWAYKATGYEARFRCVGVNYDAGTHPNTITNEWVTPTTKLKSTTTDLASATLQAATSTCWNGGGHLPTSRDLHELISEGLPNGSNNWLWTSDQQGWNGTQFLVGISKWSGTDKSFSDYYSTYATWSYRTESGRPYRCVYYPVDQAYAGPSACNGGCFLSTKGGGKVKMWMDSTDRAATRFHLAVKACNDLSGHLASERDLTELIREGLPNGSNSWIWSSDQEGYNDTQFLSGIIKWSGVDTSFTGQYSTYSTWAYKINSTSYQYPYRCVWTNELR
ncbi:MAG: hypothetical protein AMXMBFR64_08050 [Myxococcales bacterium]